MDQNAPSLQIMSLTTLEDFDTVPVDEIEVCRRAVGATAPEFAEQLGWSARKYQRTLEAAREADGYVDRDVALAVRGLVHVLLGDDDESATGVILENDLMPCGDGNAQSFLGGQVFPHVLQEVSESAGEWTKEVMHPLFRLIAGRALRRKLITYGEAATTLEENGLTKRVWPRTLYGMPLGAICSALLKLGQEGEKPRIPLLSVIVVRASGEPGPGLDPIIRDFIKQYETGEQARENLARLKRDRTSLVKELQEEVFDFPHWPGVLHALSVGGQPPAVP